MTRSNDLVSCREGNLEHAHYFQAESLLLSPGRLGSSSFKYPFDENLTQPFNFRQSRRKHLQPVLFSQTYYERFGTAADLEEKTHSYYFRHEPYPLTKTSAALEGH